MAGTSKSKGVLERIYGRASRAMAATDRVDGVYAVHSRILVQPPRRSAGFALQIGAQIDRVGRFDGSAAFGDLLNAALLIQDEGGAIGKLGFVIEDAVLLEDLALHVTQQRELHADLVGEFGVRGNGVDADADHRRVVEVDLAGVDTSLVSLEFLRSTTCKIGRASCRER